MKNDQVKVWDVGIRIFHWSLLATFVISYLTEDDFSTIHVYSGYTMMGLIALRLIWGVIGTRHARFSHFVVRPSAVIAYLIEVYQFRARRYLGHNPAGGAMIVVLLVSLSLTLFFGLLTYGAAEFSGPLAGLAGGVSDSTAHLFKEMHEFFANFSVLLVVFHVLGVVLTSLQHNENLAKSMLTGYKQKHKD